MRMSGRGDLSGVALARLARSLGLHGVYLINDAPGGIGDVLFTDGFERAAPALGIDVAGVSEVGTEPRADAVAAAVERSGADGVLLGTALAWGGGDLIEALRDRLGSGVTLLAGDGFNEPETLRDIGRAADGLYVALPGLSPSDPDLPPSARRFIRKFGARAGEDGVLEAAQAAETVLEAIARTDGTRASVLKELQETRVRDGILGDFAFDRYGDITPARFTILRVTGTRSRAANSMIVDRVIPVATE
jgi:ABC-type branched-subunit amino acid transport system substrate-binding protein